MSKSVQQQVVKVVNSPLMKGESIALLIVDPSVKQETINLLKNTNTQHFFTTGKTNNKKVDVLVLQKASVEDAAAFCQTAKADCFVFARNVKDVGRVVTTVHAQSSQRYRMGDEHPTKTRLAKREDDTWVKIGEDFFHLFAEPYADMTKHEKLWNVIGMHQMTSSTPTQIRLAHPHLYEWREAKARLEKPAFGITSILAKSEPSVGNLLEMAKKRAEHFKIKTPNAYQDEKPYLGHNRKATFDLSGHLTNALELSAKLGFTVKQTTDIAKSEVGQNTYEQAHIFASNAGSESDLVWQITHELAHAMTSDAVDFSRNQVLTKHDAYRVVDWERATMALQKSLLEMCGLSLPAEGWARETNIVLSDTIGRLTKTEVPFDKEPKKAGHWKALIDALSCKSCGTLKKGGNAMCKCDSMNKKELNPNANFDGEDLDDRMKNDPKKTAPSYYSKKTVAPPFQTPIKTHKFEGQKDEVGNGDWPSKKGDKLGKADLAPNAAQSTNPPPPAAPIPSPNKGLSGSTAPKAPMPVGRPNKAGVAPSAPRPPAPLGKNQMPESTQEPDSLEGQYQEPAIEEGDPDLQAALAKLETKWKKNKQ